MANIGHHDFWKFEYSDISCSLEDQYVTVQNFIKIGQPVAEI